MGQLVGAKITKVNKGKSGEGQYGPWQAYSFYTDKTGNDRFDYFQSGKKPAPVVGMMIAFAEYEEEQKGEYMNRKVDKFTLAEGQEQPKQPPKSNGKSPAQTTQASYSSTEFKDKCVLIAYAKDLLVAKIRHDPKFAETQLKDLMRGAVLTGLHAYQTIVNPKHDWGGNKSQPEQKEDPAKEGGNGNGDKKELFELKAWFVKNGASAKYHDILQAIGSASKEEDITDDMLSVIVEALQEEKKKVEDELPY